MKIARLLPLVLISGLLLAVPASAEDASISVPDFKFAPKSATIDVGDTVTWNFQGPTDHTATSDRGQAVKFDSGLLNAGKSFSFTFTKPGKFTFHCRPHPFMKGSVTVGKDTVAKSFTKASIKGSKHAVKATVTLKEDAKVTLSVKGPKKQVGDQEPEEGQALGVRGQAQGGQLQVHRHGRGRLQGEDHQEGNRRGWITPGGRVGSCEEREAHRAGGRGAVGRPRRCQAARAADPGRWILTGASSVPVEYWQGLTSNPAKTLVYFDGPFSGPLEHHAHAPAGLRRARPRSPPSVKTSEGYNHIGDPTWNTGDGGRVILPLECYNAAANPSNTCGTGSFGVADPRTLAWRYYVKLDKTEIPKAMWAESSPNGRLIWTSSGNDLLAYRTSDVTAANARPRGARSRRHAGSPAPCRRAA